MGLTFGSSRLPSTSSENQTQQFNALKGVGSEVIRNSSDPNRVDKQREEKDDFWPNKFLDWALIVFNGLLAIFTALLWWSTKKLWKAGEHQLDYAQCSSERQLRAYVYIEKTPIKASAEGVVDLLKNTFKVDFRVRNFGQTPAHNAVVRYAFEVVDCVGGKAKQLPTPNHTFQLGSIGPLTDFYDLADTVSGVDIATIRDGRRAIYLVGSIVYDTVFAKNLQTNFCYLVGGDVGWGGDDEMSADESGNDAT